MNSSQHPGQRRLLRPPEQITADRTRCESYRAASRTDFEQGAIDAYDWLLGRGPAPLSGAPAAPVAPQSVAEEELLAHDIVRNRPGAPPMYPAGGRWTESYVLGVRHALRWTRYASPTSPGGSTDEPANAPVLFVEPPRRPPRYRRRWED